MSGAGAGGEPRPEAWAAGRTDVGRRRGENQDDFRVAALAPGAPEPLGPEGAGGGGGEARLPVGERGMVLLVADGMGGHAAGRLASALTCRFVLEELRSGWLAPPSVSPADFPRALREAVERANGRVHQHARLHPETAGMGSTLTAAGVLGADLFLAQVGDSRAYLWRAGEAVQLTRDQSRVQQLIDAGLLRPEDAERSALSNVLLQALGVEPSVEVDLSHQSLQQEDLLLLCSDGLHRVVRPGEMAELAGRIGPPGELCEALVALANARGGPDNVTVVAARFRGDALPVAGSAGRVGYAPYAPGVGPGPAPA